MCVARVLVVFSKNPLLLHIYHKMKQHTKFQVSRIYQEGEIVMSEWINRYVSVVRICIDEKTKHLLLLLSINTHIIIRLLPRLSSSGHSSLVHSHETAGVLHFKDGVLTKVHESFKLFLVTAFRYDWVEEGTLGFLIMKKMGEMFTLASEILKNYTFSEEKHTIFKR